MSSIKDAPTFNAWFALVRPFLQALPEQSFERSTTLPAEFSGFISRRLQEDLAYWGHLANCKTPQEVQQTYFEFWQTAWTQYQDYYLRLAGATQPELETHAKPLPKYKTAA